MAHDCHGCTRAKQLVTHASGRGVLTEAGPQRQAAASTRTPAALHASSRWPYASCGTAVVLATGYTRGCERLRQQEQNRPDLPAPCVGGQTEQAHTQSVSYRDPTSRAVRLASCQAVSLESGKSACTAVSLRMRIRPASHTFPAGVAAFGWGMDTPWPNTHEACGH